MSLTKAQLQQFKIDGYLLLPDAIEQTSCERVRALARTHLEQRREPFELETDVRYPGAPESRMAPGGTTIRRLLFAEQRDPVIQRFAKNTLVIQGIQQILNSQQLWLNPNHHNCIMTKQPAHSSETLWHRDTRYWNFNNKYLINAWFALGDELAANGAMKILPGSHRWEVEDESLDEEQFLKLDHPDNRDRLATARTVELSAGDILLFSAHCFHAAGRNTTDQPKFSLVFTYHGEATKPLPKTRSAEHTAIKVA